jgi:CubicO group peptidase (beta-lactamase class C family)
MSGGLSEARLERMHDTIFCIASMTKPVAAVAAMALVEECSLRLDDPVDDLLPELSGWRIQDPAMICWKEGS